MADVRHRRLFEDAPALQANRLGLAQRQVERMDVAAAVIEQRADVAIAGNFLAYPIRIEQLELGIAVAFPVAFLLDQRMELLVVQRGEDAAGR